MKKILKKLYTTTALATILSVMASASFATSSTGGDSGTGTSTTNSGGSKSGTASGNYNNNTRAGSNTSAGSGASNDIQSGGNVANWDAENTYWRNSYPSRPYYSKSKNYTTYEPAYQYGVELYKMNPNKRYEDLDQSQLQAEWMKKRGNSILTWDQAQEASRDSYNRLYNNRNTATPKP